MTERNIFVYKLFLSLKILDFTLFFYETATPLSQQPPLKIDILSSSTPLFLKFGWRLTPSSPPSQSGKGGGRVHTMKTMYI